MRKLSVTRVLLRTEINVPVVRRVGVSFFNKIGNHFDNFIDILGRKRMNRGGPYIQPFRIGLVFVDIPFGPRPIIASLFHRLPDDFI